MEKRTKLKTFAGICFAFGLISCKSAPAPTNTATKPTTTDQFETGEAETRRADTPRSIKIRVSISRREDLRVKVGDKIAEGFIIADRTRERNALLLQKSQAEMTLKRLQTLRDTKAEELQKPVMPIQSLAEIEASIKRAQLVVEIAKRGVRLQELRLEEIKSLPFPVDFSKVRQHETSKLDLLKNEFAQTESNLFLEKAKLETGRANRSYAEQKDALEIQKQKITLNEQRLGLETQIAQLEAQTSFINASIIALSTVRAPFAGLIKKINWEGQINDEITVVILVDVDDSNSDSRAK